VDVVPRAQADARDRSDRPFLALRSSGPVATNTRAPHGKRYFSARYCAGRDDGAVVNQLVVSLTNRGRAKASEVDPTWNVWLVWTIRDGRAIRGQAFMRKGNAFEAAGLRK
jgi:hypothetical protein